MSTKQCVTDIANTPTPWESGKLGMDKQYAEAASKELGDQIDDALGLQMISIGLDKELIDRYIQTVRRKIPNGLSAFNARSIETICRR